MDESTPVADDRIPSRRKPGTSRTTWPTALAAYRRPAPSIGREGQRAGTEAFGRGGHDRDAGDIVALAPAADRSEIRWQPKAPSRPSPHGGRDRGASRSAGERKPGL